MSTENKSEYLVEVKHLKQYFPVRTGFMKTIPLKAVDDVSFSIRPGETLGLVGESGCGKTTVGRTLMHLYKPTAGEIYFEGKQVTEKNIGEFRKDMQMVFQDPYSSLDPRMTVEDIIGEPLDVHKLYSTKEERRQKVMDLMSLVGLNAEHATRYVHEFSGGQRQRIGIARALAVNPKFIVCDEPVSALDVSIQAQVINMFEELQEKLGVAYLFIAHDLLVVHHISDRIAVMYLGRMVEMADADELNENPIHPYTLSLLSAVPVPDPKTAKASQRIILEGDVPSPLKMPSGCPFRTRCRYATEQCACEMPPLTDKKWMPLPCPATLSSETSEPMTDTSKKEESKEDSESAEHAPLSTVTNVTTVTPAQSQSKDSNTAMTAKQYYSAELNFEEGPDNHLTRKIVAGVLTAVVVIALVNTIGVFGVAGLGILAGGCVK